MFIVVKLVPLKIVNSNAAHMNGGIPFSKAFCELEIGEKRFSFGDVFRRGIDLCLDYIEGKLPDKKSERIVLDRLVQFLTTGNYVVHINTVWLNLIAYPTNCLFYILLIFLKLPWLGL